MKVPEIPVLFTDAGPPPSLVFLATWTLVLGFSYLVFGLARTAVCVTSPSYLHERKRAVRYSAQWWVHRLHLCVFSWLIFDVVYRVFSFIFLPSHVLWRRHLLPLHEGAYGWLVNQIRFGIMCGIPDEYSFGMCADWKLPLAVFPVPEYSVSERKRSMNESEQACCQWVALTSLVTVVCIFFLGWNLVFRFLRPCGIRREMSDVDRSPVLGAVDSDTDEKYEFDSGLDEIQWWGLGESDDSCLSSPEALAEEIRWRALEEEKRMSRCCQEQCGYAWILLFCECWPVLLAVCYAGLYAMSGSMPLLMRWVYPGCVVLVVCFAMSV